MAHMPKALKNSPPELEGYFCVGVIVAAHGIKGEVKIKHYTEMPEDVIAYGSLMDQNQSPVELKNLRVTAKGIVAKVKGTQYRDQAEAQKGTFLYASVEELPELDSDDVYLNSLVGMLAVNEAGDSVGEVVGYFDNGAHWVFEVKAEDNLLTLPFTDDLVVEVSEDRIVLSEMIEDFLNL